MSDQDNVAVIQRTFDAFGRGDIQAIMDNCTADCEFLAPGPGAIPYSGIHKGRDAIKNSYFGPLVSTQSNQKLVIGRFVAQGETVVAIGQYSATVNATGKAIESPIALIFDLQGGKVRSLQILGDTAAVAAAYAGSAAAAR